VTSCEGVGLQKTLRFSELTFVPAKDGKHTATLTVRACSVLLVSLHLSCSFQLLSTALPFV